MDRSGDKCEGCGLPIKIGDLVKFVQDTRRECRGLQSFYVWHEKCFDDGAANKLDGLAREARSQGMRVQIDWRRPLFSFYRGENLLLELRVWPITVEYWRKDAR